MTEHSLFPAFVVMDYASGVAPHKMIVPTRAYNPDLGTGGHGGYVNWSSAEVDSEDMINALCAVLGPLYPSSVDFTLATIYTMDSPTAEPHPRYSFPPTFTGTSADTGWEKAAQLCFTFRTSLFGQLHINLLDAPTGNVWGKITVLTTAMTNLSALIINPAWAWAGRDGGQPIARISISAHLNKRLRRAYRMV